MSRQRILVIGNPMNGFTFVGPFETENAAVDFAETDPEIKQMVEWWVAPLDSEENWEAGLGDDDEGEDRGA